MAWVFRNRSEARYWIKAFAWYALAEAVIQLLFFVILNNFGNRRVTIPEFHLVMWLFQCVLIWPLWWVAWSARRQQVFVQVFVNALFYVVYTYCWFGPVQEAIAHVYNGLQQVTRQSGDRQAPVLDNGSDSSYLNYQLLKHAFRLSWFYLAAYFYNYKQEEKQKAELAVANKELQLKLLKWRLNPSFYFKTIQQLKRSAVTGPSNAADPILQLAKVMEYVIYDAREPQVEMKKELEFLFNYTALINRQHPDKPIEINIEGGYDKLHIAPLLLAGLVDDIADNHDANEYERNCRMTFSFDENRLLLSVMGLKAKPAEPPLFAEIYKGRFSSAFSDGNRYELNIQLDAA